MKILTYNTWHGLDAQGLLAFGALEGKKRFEARQQVQFEQLRSLDADLCFFQEVNPLPARARRLARSLGLESVHQIDQSGIKVFGLGIPYNLNCGLAIFSRPGWRLRKLGSVRLSGPPGFSSDWLGVQFAEFRYALLAEAHVPDLGTLLLVNVHLHHGMELNTEFESQLRELSAQGFLSGGACDELIETMTAASIRRQIEIRRALEEIDRRRSRYQGVILAGDFNAEPESLAVRHVISRGYVDVHAKLRPDDPGYTFDSVRNRIAHGFLERFQLPLPKIHDPVAQRFVRGRDGRRRRIDYIFLSQELAPLARSVSLYGEEPQGGITGSDHFGVTAVLERNPDGI